VTNDNRHREMIPTYKIGAIQPPNRHTYLSHYFAGWAFTGGIGGNMQPWINATNYEGASPAASPFDE
jgi:hypothetical protein